MICTVRTQDYSASDDICDVLESLEHMHMTGIATLTLHPPCPRSAPNCPPNLQASFVFPPPALAEPTHGDSLNSSLSYDLTIAKAVCTVQTFKNDLTGPMLSLFAQYYMSTGWLVILYDRFGQHKDFIEPLLQGPFRGRLLYHPYTMLQLIFPSVYDDEYRTKQVGLWLRVLWGI